MEDNLGKVFATGQAVPETGQYQLQGDDTRPDIQRIDTGRVLMFQEGETLPPHPDTGQAAEWRFVRVAHRDGHLTSDTLNRPTSEE